MRILITRPNDDAQRLAEVLSARGHHSIVSPLLNIAPLPEAERASSWNAIGAIAFTSRNALHVVAGWSRIKELTGVRTFCVGPKTAELAAEVGFHNLAGWSATAQDLSHDIAAAWPRLITTGAVRRDQRVLHIAGADIAADLVGTLNAQGIAAEKTVVYRAVQATALTCDAASALASRELDSVLLYSPRTARVFQDLVSAAQLQNRLNAISALCLSENVAAALGDLRTRFARVAVAEKPNGKEMLALIDRMAAQLGP
ncbi:MAG: uroporphyrinogen-III synthase [Pseudomonadota bacterium]